MKFSRIIHSRGNFYYLDGKLLQDGDKIEGRYPNSVMITGTFHIYSGLDGNVIYLKTKNNILINLDEDILLRQISSPSQHRIIRNSSISNLSLSQR